MNVSSLQADPQVVCLSVTLDPADPPQAQLLRVLQRAGYYDPVGQAQFDCGGLIRLLLGQHLGVSPWQNGVQANPSRQLPRRTLRSVQSGDKIVPDWKLTEDWCPPAWGGRR